MKILVEKSAIEHAIKSLEYCVDYKGIAEAIRVLQEALDPELWHCNKCGKNHCQCPPWIESNYKPAEQAKQEPVAKPIGKEGRELWFKEVIDSTNAVLRETNEVEQIVNQERIEEHRALTSRNNAVVKESLTVQWQAEQEPVAWLWVNEQGSERLEWEPVQDISKWKSTPLYATPVRTKDMTDAEIATLVQRHTIDGKIMPFALCEAVIAADREKNK